MTEGSLRAEVAEQLYAVQRSIGESPGPAPLQRDLFALTHAVCELLLADRCASDQAGASTIVRDLRVLTEETLSPDPRPEWLTLSSHSLVDAAERYGSDPSAADEVRALVGVVTDPASRPGPTVGRHDRPRRPS